MSRISSISYNTIFKQAFPIIFHPWIWRKFVNLQVKKQFFNLNFSRRSGKAGKVMQLSIRLTDICNLRCLTCGQWGENGFLHQQDMKQLKKNEVKADRYVEIITDLVRHGHHPPVYFWGGEPMLYDGIVELINKCTGLRLPVSIASNGTGIAQAAEALVTAPLFLLQISIDGHCHELHNRIRPSSGKGDNFRDIENGLGQVIASRGKHHSKLPLIASLTTISKENSAHLVDIYRTFRDRVDIFVFYLSWWIDDEHSLLHVKDFFSRFGFSPELHKGWNGNWRPGDFKLLHEQLSRLLKESRSLKSPAVVILPNITGEKDLATYYQDHSSSFGFNQCRSIFHAAEINSNGDMSPCRDYHDYVVGNIREKTIIELWNSEKYTKFRQSLENDGLLPVCRRCCGLMGF